MSFAKHPVRTPAAGSWFYDPFSQNAHFNRLSGGAGVSRYRDWLSDILEKVNGIENFPLKQELWQE